ncbi:MAG: abortive infection family protein [Hyphomicrobiaceae bacterium]
MAFLSPQSIEALAEMITGGAGNSTSPAIGHYRSAYYIERFMRSCNVEFALAGRSRVPAVVECLIDLNGRDDAQEVITRVIETVAAPSDFIDAPEKLTAVVEYLNKRLRFDRLTLQVSGIDVRLRRANDAGMVLGALSAKLDVIDFDTVKRDLDRALVSAERDPEDAVTAACSAVESVCRSILVELGEPLPAKKDIQGLYRAVRDPLDLSPDRANLPTEVADDIRSILGGLNTAIQGVGALRTHAGDAHGRERGFRRIDARIARLSIHSASAVILFLIETWEKKYPKKPLRRHT